MQWRNTTGPANSLVLSVKDGMSSSLIAGCQDVAYLQVEVVDAQGNVVPTASDLVTFTVSGPVLLAGTANGDPAEHTNNLSPSRPAFHGLVLGVLLAGDEAGAVKVQATAPGLTSATLLLSVEPQPAGMNEFWCKNGLRL